jgi:Lar family restriction alleviation protein
MPNREEITPADLLPCPFCGGTASCEALMIGQAGKDNATPRAHFIECQGCLALSGSADSPEEAGEKWNRRAAGTGERSEPAPSHPQALPLESLRWTREKPTRDGWYCYRAPGARGWAVADIQMFTGAPCWHSAEKAAWVAVWPDLEWAGPIPEPQAPKGSGEGGSAT